jgi:pimeloyl-ACP methyl ester carboxylesterase
MYYEARGEGEPLLLIRGLGSTCDGFKAQVEGLSPYFRVISFDNRCVGRSDQPQHPFTISDMADDTAALLDSLSIQALTSLAFRLEDGRARIGASASIEGAQAWSRLHTRGPANGRSFS